MSLENPNDFGKNKRARMESTGLNMATEHFSGLYDLNEDMSGEKVDLATGKPINNSTNDLGPQKLRIEKHTGGSEDALPPLPKEKDAAAKWLRENGIK